MYMYMGESNSCLTLIEQYRENTLYLVDDYVT